MNFMGIGPGELLLILLIALIIFGPGRLPELGKALGKSIREFRRATQDVTSQISKELQELEKEIQLEVPVPEAKKTEDEKN